MNCTRCDELKDYVQEGVYTDPNYDYWELISVPKECIYTIWTPMEREIFSYY